MSITRDQKEQNKYKSDLMDESLRIFGKCICWASQKPYKGLIASHIKPYKLCVLEGDKVSQYNLDNGLLLSKDLDAYFDKFEITFDNEGKIIFSEKVDEEIKNDYSDYKLDERIFNSNRKKYMEIHRSLFYYINYYNKGIKVPYQITSLPTFNCPLLYLKQYDTFVLFEENYPRIIPIHKLKSTLLKEDGYKTLASNEVVANAIKKEDRYVSAKLFSKTIFNLKNGKYDLQKMDYVQSTDSIVINKIDALVDNEAPDKFLNLIYNIFASQELVNCLQMIIGHALLGDGFEKAICLYGNKEAVNLFIDILSMVFGQQFYRYDNSKILYKKPAQLNPIQNCNLLFIDNQFSLTDKIYLKELIKCSYFPKTVLNINNYTLLITSEKPIKNDLVLNIKCNYISNLDIKVETLVEEEKNQILGWAICGAKKYDYSLVNILSKGTIIPSYDTNIEKWFNERCVNRPFHNELATKLYYDFNEYCIKENLESITQVLFGRYLGKKILKKNINGYVYYVDVELKK